MRSRARRASSGSACAMSVIVTSPHTEPSRTTTSRLTPRSIIWWMASSTLAAGSDRRSRARHDLVQRDLGAVALLGDDLSQVPLGHDTDQIGVVDDERGPDGALDEPAGGARDRARGGQPRSARSSGLDDHPRQSFRRRLWTVLSRRRGGIASPSIGSAGSRGPDGRARVRHTRCP